MKSAVIAGLATAMIALTAPALAQEPAGFRLSTGGKGNAYWRACESLVQDVRSVSPGQCLESSGSEMNIERLRNGEADLAFVQADSVALSKDSGRLSDLVQIADIGYEMIFVVCNRATGFDEVSDLPDANPKPIMVVGEIGSGARTTLMNWRKEDASYEKVSIQLGPLNDATILKLVQNQIQCVMVVGSPTGATMKRLDELSQGKLKLLEIDDWDFNNSKDLEGRLVYEFHNIDRKLFRNLDTNGWGGFQVTRQKAILLARRDWLKENDAVVNSIASVILLKNGNLLQ